MTSDKSATPSIEQALGAAIASRRAELDLSQKELAERLTAAGMPVDASAVSRIEKGVRSVRLTEALTISSVLKVDLEFLLGDIRTPSQEFNHHLHLISQQSLQVHREIGKYFRLIEAAYIYAINHNEFLNGEFERISEFEGPDAVFTLLENEAKRWGGPTVTARDEEQREKYLAAISALSRGLIYVHETD